MDFKNITVLPMREVFKVNPILHDFFLIFNLLFLSEVIGVLGIVGNIINICNFYRQGFSDSVTVTLTALAVSDIGALVTQQGCNIMFPLSLMKYDLDFFIVDIMNAFFIYPHGYFLRTSGFITAFASFERCVSVVLPLSVRLICTKKLALIVNLSIFVILSMYIFPVFYAGQLGFKNKPGTNRTYLAMLFKPNVDEILRVSYPITDLMLPYLTFLVIVVCTSIIIYQLKIKAKWRTAVTSVGKRKDLESSKEKKTTTMLVAVSVIFVVCMIPYSSMLTALSIVRELKVSGIYFDITAVCYSFVFLMDTIHCSVRILVYLKMSSRYRSVAQQMLREFKARIGWTGNSVEKEKIVKHYGETFRKNNMPVIRAHD